MGELSRERLLDVAAVLIGAAVGGVLLQEVLSSRVDPGYSVAWDLGVGAIGYVLLLAFRRRWPVTLALLFLGGMAFSVSMWGAAGVAVYTTAARRRWPVVAAVGGLYAVVMALYYVGYSADSETFRVADLLTQELLLGILVSAGLLVRSRNLLMESLRERAVQAEAGQRLRIEDARRLERQRIAREMHDVLAHRISLLAMHAGVLEFRPNAPPEQVARTVSVIRGSAFEALEELRTVIGVLRDAGTDDRTAAGPTSPQPVLANLPDLVAESRAAGMAVTLVDRIAEPDAAPAGQGRHLYRIVQEGLTNARKHARGAEVGITVDGTPGGDLTVEIRNQLPVVGARSDVPGAGAGLVGLAERVQLAGGELAHGPTTDGDFRLWARLPWRT